MDNTFEPFLTLEVRNGLVQHMLDEAPNECCGVITLSKGKYAYIRKENVHREPEHHFSFDKKTKAEVNTKKSVVAYCHSHPTGPAVPSKKDMEIQTAIRKPSVIASVSPDTGLIDLFSFGDHLLDAPLEGRDFRYGQFDCLHAIRSYVWQIEQRYMPPAPASEDGWWNIGKDDPAELADNPNLYEKNFKNYGYREFTPDLENPSSVNYPREGDILLMQMGAPVINHAAVYIGNNLIYHHRFGKQSGTTPIGYVLGANYIRKWVRHEQN